MTDPAKPEPIKIGDRVSWMGCIDFGRREVRWTGTVIAIRCGVPYYFDPPQYTSDGYGREAGRHPAVKVRIDNPQHGETRPNYFSEVVIENAKLTLIESQP
jgi:hypothetical protein